MKYKEFEIILSSFNCNKNCPYCTAKITKWPSVEDNIDKLEETLLTLKNKGICFRYFILSGNGEPSMHSYEKLKKIAEATRNVSIFDEKRIQSSGNIFYEPEKLEMVKDDFIVEVTRVDFDSAKDMKILGYDKDYIASDNFKKARIRLNYVMLKNKSVEQYLEEIKRYVNTYPNIETISLKTLNLNTLNGQTDNKYSQWILENALTKNDAAEVIEKMNKYARFEWKDERFFDRYEWEYENKPITFYVKKLDYGLSNIVWYGGKLVNYGLKEIEI
ncbi:MAG: 4Fe-4S cluster-binding domain-containing protein [Alphaproteobacteria bacterium]|nr:4Fe-4S cluster-binding domain-containing protein [Alphaproteobacteria bacterium]